MKHATAVRRLCLIVSGGITIGLELVTSRLLTPYFGSSLYVWTAVLSVTLAALATGYYLGSRRTRSARFDVRDFSAGLAIGALALVCARLSCPILPFLASGNLVVGSFLGSAIVLGPALTVLSALNPVLIAIERDAGRGDGGSGFIFALSTAGSIAGAVVTSFVIIPNVPILNVLLVFAALAVTMSVLSALGTSSLNVRQAPLLIAAMIAVPIVAMKVVTPSEIHGDNWVVSLLRVYHSPSAQVSVLQLAEQGQPVRYIYSQSGGVESTVYETGEPASLYPLAIDRVIARRMPNASRVLVLGLAGGSLQKLLHRRGITVDTIDINPDASRIAQDYFRFDPSEARVVTEDARVGLRGCRNTAAYDAIVFDVFSGVDPIYAAATVEAMRDAKSCISSGGALIANAISSGRNSLWENTLAAGMGAVTNVPVWAYAARDANGYVQSNVTLFSGGENAEMPIRLDRKRFPALPSLPSDDSLFTPWKVAGAVEPLSDRLDRGPLLFAASQLQARKHNQMLMPAGW